MFSSTEVTMQQMVLASMKIIILCQRHKGILVSLSKKKKKGGNRRSQTLTRRTGDPTMHCNIPLILKNSYLDLVPKICPTTRLDTPIPTICVDVARPMAVPRVA